MSQQMSLCALTVATECCCCLLRNPLHSVQTLLRQRAHATLPPYLIKEQL